MRLHSLRCLHGVFALLLLLAGTLAVAAAPPERGFPLIQAYEPNLPEASTQFFDVTRDSRGVLYFGNLNGVLVFDGAWWRRIEVGKGITAYRVASGENGKVGVGGVDEIGYLTPDGRGTLRYVSLLPLLPPGQRKLGQVLAIRPLAQGFAFMTSRWLLIWDGTRVTTVATFPGDRPYAALFSVGPESYVWSRQGISRLQGMRLEPVPGGEVFRGRRVDQILPADGGLLVSVRGEGLFLLRGGKAEPFAPEASRWTAAKRVLEGIRLADGRWALGSVLGGLLLLRPDGAVDQVIDTAAGLSDDFVSGLVEDREGSLWLALNNGLARVEIASPLSVLDRRTGLRGETYSMARHRGALWIGTSGGLFTTAGAETGPPAHLRLVPGVVPSIWSLLSSGDDLLAGTAFGVFQVRGTAPFLVPGSDQSTTYVLARSDADPERVWVGQEDGLAAIRRDGERWRFEGKIVDLSSEIRSIVEGEDGTVWCGTLLDGVIGVQVPAAPGPVKPRLRRVAASEGANVFRIGRRILAVKDNQVLRLDESRGALVRDPALAGVRAQTDFSLLAEDAGGNLWMNSRPPAVARRRGAGWEPAPRSLAGVPGRNAETILTEPDGVVWLATDKGLVRYEGTVQSPAMALPPPLLARLTSSGALLFGGAPGVAPRMADLPPYLRHLRIEFAPLSFRAGLRYQTRLEPLDAGWSAPTAEPFAELTRLPPGAYAFHVRTLGPNGEQGPETGWSFHVRSPWYQTPLALALWLALGLLAVWGYAWLRGRALHQRAARLEARVNEQTLELRSTVEELRRAHDDLGAANARLEELSLRDELTGIANRRRLQQALAEEWGHTRQSIAFVLLDLDFFKRLNDTHGHLAGDLCLQSVAGLLAAAARRNGGLAARYGGEELAVLLPGLSLAGALKVAEQLREGIEALAIPNEAAPLKRVTASFGAVAMLPSLGQTAEGLIEAADQALYRAKAEGKNRVCAGGVRSEAGGERTSPAA
ncbi:MAG TPA: diguanylate cyclase [Thermoanaerobaculia bacterium]|jgi:diguanylate cyclase (GGDEF)-like protein|nr:diguanylate cyclase [Thermoanaerobaculia bacterium]